MRQNSITEKPLRNGLGDFFCILVTRWENQNSCLRDHSAFLFIRLAQTASNPCGFEGFFVVRAHSKSKGYLFLSAFLAENWQAQNFGRDVVFSADLCYNGMGDDNG